MERRKQKNKTLLCGVFTLSVLGVLFLLPDSRAQAAVTATMGLSPTAVTIGVNQTATININMDTMGNDTDGVDIFSLHFNPSVLQVVDDNSSLSGVQITPGTLLPITVVNTVSNSLGTIQFSQASSGGTSFRGAGVFGTIHFRGVAGGTSALTLDFTRGSTVDTNIAFQGSDLLNTVTNGSITVDSTGPTVSITAPSSGSSVSGNTTVSATASDTGGVAGVQFKLDGANLGAEDITSPYSVNWDTTLSANGLHTLSAVARDNAGNSTTSGSVSATVSNLVSFQRTIQLDLEGRTSDAVSGTLNVLNTSKVLLKSYSFTTGTTGLATITFDIPAQTVYLKVNPIPFLARVFSVDLASNVTYILPRLWTGDTNQDNIVNSVDYSLLNSRWFSADLTTDLNRDGVVNSIDFSFMNQHWLVTGEQ